MFTTATALPYVGLRYMNVYGPRQDYSGAYIAVIMKMLDAIDRGEPLDDLRRRQPGLRLRRTSATAREANVCAMQADAVDRFYNVGTGKRTSITELAEMLLRITGSDVGDPVRSPRASRSCKNRIGSTERAPRRDRLRGASRASRRACER